MLSANENGRLTSASIDGFSEKAAEICKAEGMDSKATARIRLSVEEILLSWREKYGEEQEVSLGTASFLWRHTLTLKCRNGTGCNPYEEGSEAYGRQSILKLIGLLPEYFYDHGCNHVVFRLKGREMNPLVKLLTVLLLSAFIGVLGRLLIPGEILGALNEIILTPVYQKFLDILGCIAGPLIFCSVAWGIYGMGDASTLNRLGKGLVGHLLCAVLLASLGSLLFLPLFHCSYLGEAADLSQIGEILELFLSGIPGNILEPFLTGNTLQIIVLGTVMGLCLLYLGTRTRAVALAIEQINLVVGLMMEMIGKLVPGFIAVVVVTLIWSDDLKVLRSSGRFILLLILGLGLEILTFALYTAIRQRMSPLTLLRKAMPAYLVALATASSAAAFEKATDSCQNSFGISASLTGFGVPVGVILQKCGSTINNMLIIFYLSEIFSVDLSLSRILMAVLVSALTAVATPPVPGGGTIAYIALLTQMDLPMEGLAIVLAIDMLGDFLITSSDILCMQLALVNVSAKFNLLDRGILLDKSKSGC